jgi:hypothetical protein
MAGPQTNIDLKALRAAILSWLKTRLDPKAYQKLNKTFQSLLDGAEDWEVFSSFSGVPKYTGKDKLDLTGKDLEEADKIRSGWNPGHWRTDQLGRTLLLLGIAERDKEEFLDKLEKIFISSDMGEAEALYQSLPVLPYPEELQNRAAEGVRSNITSVFDAVALRNPYPADYMDDDAWNQIVLKALFVGSPFYLIYGIDRRANKKLARMLVEYAHERWSAGRKVSPELWRPVGPFIDDGYSAELKKVLKNPEDIQKSAAVLALTASDSDDAKKLLKQNSEIVESIKGKKISWEDIGKQWQEEEH